MPDKSLRAEIVTAFAYRKGSLNVDLVRADLDASLLPSRDGEAAKRTNVIKRLGRSDRVLAEKETAPHRGGTTQRTKT